MTDAAQDVPAQPGATMVADASKSTVETKRSRGGAMTDKATAMVGDAYDKATAIAGDAYDKAGDALHDAAGKATVALHDAADKAEDAAGRAAVRIRNNATLPATRGTTIIANEVVEKIAGIATREVPGVYDLGGDTARVLTAVRERLHLGNESQAQGVSVKLEGKEADLHITVVIEFGFVVASVCDKVREKVISSVENLLGLDVTNVDILVDDIHVENDGPVGDDVARAAGYSSDTPGIKVG